MLHAYVCVCAFGDDDDDSGENEAHADQCTMAYRVFFFSIHHFYYCESHSSSLSVPVTKHLIFSLKTSKGVHFSL